MKRWNEFAAERPEMAEAGHALIYQFRVGLGYLATIRRDGGPRVHPVCPVIANGGLYVFIGNHSPKLRDLQRDGRFALHSFPNPEVDDEFYVSGCVRRVDDPQIRRTVHEAYTATGAFTADDTLFELWLERALHAKYGPRPSWPPVYTKWLAGDAGGSSRACQPRRRSRPPGNQASFMRGPVGGGGSTPALHGAPSGR